MLTVVLRAASCLGESCGLFAEGHGHCVGTALFRYIVVRGVQRWRAMKGTHFLNVFFAILPSPVVIVLVYFVVLEATAPLFQ